MKELRSRLCGVILLMATLLLLTGCSAMMELANGSSAGDVFDALKADIVGETPQEYNLVVVSLPRHSGYDVIADKRAFESLHTEEEREAYEAIEQSVFMITDINVEEVGGFYTARATIPSLDSGTIFKVKEAVMADHPEAFWLTGDYSLGYNFHDGNYINLHSEYSYTDILSMSDALENSVAEVLREIPSGMTEFERELIIHDILVRDVSYDVLAAAELEGSGDVSTSYGALVNRKAVCSGYSMAAKLLFNRVGISCTTVKGISKDEGHMWNIVNIADEWYHLDITWDDPTIHDAQGIVRYDYFNLTDEYISADHEISAGYELLTEEIIRQQGDTGIDFYNFDLPECNSTKSNFYVKQGQEITALNDDSVDIITALFKRHSVQGSGNIYLTFPQNMDQSLVVDWLSDALTYARRKSNEVSSDNGGRRIKSIVYIERDADTPEHLKNVYCVRLIFA